MTKDIVVNHRLRLIGTPLGAGSAGIQGIFHGPVYYYLLAIPFILFGGNPIGGTILMFVFGLLSLVMAFILGKATMGKAGGLIFMLLVGISPLFIAQSRFIWSPYPSTLFILIALYFISKLRDGARNIFLAGFFSVFIYNFELAIAVPMAMGLLIYSITLFGLKKLKPYIFLFTGFITALLPMILFEIKHGWVGGKGMLLYLTTSPKAGHSEGSFLPEHFQSFLFSFKNTFPVMPLGVLIAFGILMLLTFMFFLRRETDKNHMGFMLFLALLPLLNFIILSFLMNTIYPYYLYHVSIIYLLIFTYCIIKSIKYKIVNYVLLFFLGFVTIAAIVKNYVMFKYDITDYGGTAKLKGKIDAIDYIYKDAKGEKFGLFVFSPPVYTYPYDYITDWYGSKKYGYTPNTSKNSTFYLLIEVDPDKSWSYNGWLETVIKSGKIEKTVKLPSGFIVQKRTGSLTK